MSNIVLLLSANLQKEVMSFYANNFVERKAPGVIFAAKMTPGAFRSIKCGP